MTKSIVRDMSSNPATEPLERRRAPRHVAWVPAYVALPADGIERLCVTHDVSRSGGLVMTQVNLRPGEPVTVELFLSSDTTQPKVARAHVVRSQRRAQPNTFWTFDAAIRFDDPIDDAEADVEQIAERQRGWWPNRSET